MPTINRGHRPLLVPILLAVALTVGVACSSAAAPSRSGAATSPSASEPSPGGSEPGGGSTGDPGTGIALPIDPTPIDPAAGQPTLVVPKPGRLNPHPVAPQTLQASVDGRHVLVKITWASGIAPCSVLDSVKLERSGTTIALTVIEGADQLDVACAELAMLKATIVDLGELDAGTWTITATNSDAAPIEVTIS
jgi:hypothetical protein